MSEENDAQLLALFARSHAALPSTDFRESFGVRLERARRIRTLRRIALLAAAAILAAWFMPSILQRTAAAAHTLGEFSGSYIRLVISPAGWAVSTLIALGVLVRTGSLRRR
ncbi:MAG TPA: hypothetical protein VHU43_02010 [Steroidobacteraceae bacterium]|jgi:hypothetical protein|nr:hypothetical protein [Steroidobacteraceae bacterium]